MSPPPRHICRGATLRKERQTAGMASAERGRNGAAQIPLW